MSHLNINGVDKPLDHIRLNNVRTENLVDDPSTYVNGYINSSGNLVGQSATNLEKTSLFMPIPSGTTELTLSSKDAFPSGANGVWIAIACYSSNTLNSFLGRRTSSEQTLTYEIPAGTKYARVSLRTYGDTVYCMLNTGSTTKPYVPYLITKEAWEAKSRVILHGLTNPLCGIGTYKDTLDLSTGLLTRYVKKLVLTGNELWGEDTQESATNFFSTGAEIPAGTDLALSSHFALEKIYTSTTVVGFYITASGRLRIRPDNVASTSPADFKAYLADQYAAGTPVTVWYVLATPETEQITLPSNLTGIVEGYLTQGSTPSQTSPVYPTANGAPEQGGTYSLDTGAYAIAWGRADTFTGANSISARCYGLPVKSWEIDGNSQQSGVPSPDKIIMPTFCGKLIGTDWTIPITSAGQTVPVYLGQVQTVRRVKKLVLDGTEEWSFYNANASGIGAWTNLADAMEDGRENCFCTHLKPIATPYQSTGNVCSAGVRNTRFYIAFNANTALALGLSDLQSIKSWIQQQYTDGTPVTVWYVLATPETATVNEPLTKIGDYADTLTSEQAGITIPTTDGNNTISVDTSLVPSRFEIKVHAKPIHYGFKIDKSVSDPSNAVIYTHDAVTMTPAGMDFTNGVFDYGSWENVWFIKNARPVMLNFDGTEAYDLDPNDYSKKLNGTPSDIADSTKDMNAMIAFPTVWIKRTDDASYNYIEISDRQLDSDFHAYAHEDTNGTVKPYIYLPIYKGSMIDGKLRSISGVKPQSGTTAQQEVDAASALGTGWQIWDYTSKEMLCDLLTLISKSLDTQGKFGQGHSTGGSSASDFLDCGTLNDKGKFFGYSTTTSQVKCFGIEALWGERWDRELGLILDAGVYKIKEHPAYNLTGDGYTAISTSIAKCPTSNDYIKTEVSTQYGSLPTVVGGTESTYYCDIFIQNQSGINVAIRGGADNSGAYAGLRGVNVTLVAPHSAWTIGASPIYK